LVMTSTSAQPMAVLALRTLLALAGAGCPCRQTHTATATTAAAISSSRHTDATTTVFIGSPSSEVESPPETPPANFHSVHGPIRQTEKSVFDFIDP